MVTYIICLVLLLTSGLVSAKFVSTPENISPSRTESVVLRCDPEVKNALAILAVNIRKKQSNTNSKSALSDTPGQTGQLGNPAETGQYQEATTTTTPAIIDFPRLDRLQKHSRRRRQSEDEFVRATLTAGNTTDIVPMGGRFTVAGVIDKPSYLSVTIIKPSTKDIGLYECELTVLDMSGTLKTTYELTQIKEVVELTVQDLEQRVKQLERDRDSNAVFIHKMEKEVDRCVQSNIFVQEDMKDLQKKTDDLFNTITELTKEVSSVSARVSSGGAGQKDQGSRRGGNQYGNGDEFFKLSARIDELITNQIHALAKNLNELRDYLRNAQERVIDLENSVSGPLNKRLKTLEDFKWMGIKESLENMELRTVPLLLMNITQVHNNVSDLKSRLITCCGDVPQTTVEETTPTSSSLSSTLETPTTTTTIEELITNYTVPACFVCGNNITEEKCLITMKNKTSACPTTQPFCITDLYQDGFIRHIYKRCASEKECIEDKAKSSAECSTDDLRKPKKLECHFCCSSILCNSNIRPQVDLY